MPGRLDIADEVMGLAGCVYIADDPPRLYEQLLCAGPRGGFLPLESGVYRYDGTTARIVSFDEYKDDVDTSTCEIVDEPVAGFPKQGPLKWQLTFPATS